VSIPPPEFPPPTLPPMQPPTQPPAGADAPAVSPAAPATPAPWSAGRRAALVIGIVAAVLGILTGAIVGAVSLASVVAQQVGGITDAGVEPAPAPVPEPSEDDLRDPVTPDDLAEGAPGPLVPLEPTECPDDCFTADVLEELVPDYRLYLDADLSVVVDVLGDYTPQPVSKDVVLSERLWKDEGGEPDACFFTYLSTPIAVELDSEVRSIDDRTWYLTSRETADKYGVITTSARIFPDTAAASAHLSEVSRLVAGCPEYEVGRAETYWTAELTPAPALDLPPTVAAAGWVEDSPFGRFYVIDLQRGNLVVRTGLYTDGLITQEQSNDFSEKLALVLAEVDPK
jgi:hypothetical protein